MQAIPTDVSKNWVAELQREADVDEETALTIVTKTLGDHRLALGTVNSEQDIVDTIDIVRGHLRNFDLSEYGVSEEEWETLREEMVDDLRAELYDEYLEDTDGIPSIHSKDGIRTVFEKTTLSAEEVGEVYADVYGGVGDAPIGAAESTTDSLSEGPGDVYESDSAGFGAGGFASAGNDRLKELLEEADEAGRECPECGETFDEPVSYCSNCGCAFEETEE